MNSDNFHDLEAERAVLGSMLLGGIEAVNEAFEILNTQDFSDRFHNMVACAFARLAEEGQPLDVVMLASTLEDLGAAPSLSKLVELTESVPTAANIKHYAITVKRKSRLRAIRAAAQATVEATNHAENPDTVIEEAQAKLLELADHSQREAEVWADEIARRTFEHIERVKNNQSVLGVATGLSVFDEGGGLRPEEVTVIGARPKCGKTAMAGNIALNVAAAGHRVLVVSLEMSIEALGIRWAAMKSRVNSLRIERSWMLEDHEWMRLAGAFGTMGELPLGVFRAGGMTIERLQTTARRIHARNKLGLIIVDYLQLMEASTERGDGRRVEIDKVSRGLKALAVQLKIPVLALTQLNRECEKRTDENGNKGVPMYSDLRESGGIENDAAAVFLLYRPHVYHEEADPRECWVIIGAHRYSAPGVRKVRFTAEHSIFEEAIQR